MYFVATEEMNKRHVSPDQLRGLSRALRGVIPRIFEETTINGDGIRLLHVHEKEFQNQIVGLIKGYSDSDAHEKFIEIYFGEEIALFEANFQPT